MFDIGQHKLQIKKSKSKLQIANYKLHTAKCKLQTAKGKLQKAETRPVIAIFLPNSRAQMFEGHLVGCVFELTEQVTRLKVGQRAEPINMRNSNKSHLDCLHPVTRNYVSLTLIQI